MKYLSVCSGIEAASVAWHSLGWTPLAFSEIEKFPSQVLAHHYPNTPNLGDMTQFKEWNFESDVNVLVGGTPCQSFSVAGLRKGLDDPRGNLMLTYLAIAAKQRPKWVVWENVPGVLSSNGGLDFASFLRGLGQLGYGFAYRVLDAQYFGVAQRRRRVFVVGCAGDWRAAAAVLFERHSLQGYPAPSREKREGVAPSTRASTSVGSLCARTGQSISVQDAEQGHLMPAMHSEISPALKARDAKGPSSDGDGDGDGAILVPMSRPIALQDVRAVEKMQNGKGWNDDGTAYTVDTHATQGVMQPIAFDMAQITSKANGSRAEPGLPSGTLAKGSSMHVAQAMAFPWQSALDPIGNPVNLSGTLVKNQTMAVAQPIGLDEEQNAMVDAFGTLKARTAGGGFEGSVMQTNMAVRRLTPVECERLQGFPDNYTDIQPKGKATPDGPRYKALGNSMAVPVMRWIGERIAQVEAIHAS